MAQITLVVLCHNLSPFLKHCPFHLRNLKTEWKSSVLNSAEEDNNFPWSDHTFNLDHNAICLICNKNASLAHFQFGSNHNISLPSHRCSVQPVVNPACTVAVLIYIGTELHNCSSWTSWGFVGPKLRFLKVQVNWISTTRCIKLSLPPI